MEVYKKLITYISGLYIISLSLHYWDIKSIRISEIIFIFVFLLFIYGVYIKFFILRFTKLDLITSLFFLTNILLIILKNFSGESILGLLFSLYLYFIYYIFRNIFEKININYILNYIFILTIFTSTLGILGWVLYQYNIVNIFANERNYPFFIGYPVQSAALYVSPNLLAFSLIIGIIFLLLTKIKHSIKLFFLVVFNIALLLTFSKSIVIYLGILFLILSNKMINANIKKMIILLSFAFFIMHSFLTNFFILDNTKNYTWLDEKYTHSDSKPIFENFNFKIIPTNYFFLKEKSINLVKNNFFTGIGYEKFRNINDKYPLLDDQKPHSTYFGVFSEFGILGILSVITIFFYNLRISLIKKEYYIYPLIVYLLFEGINTDILSLKLIWIIFAFNHYFNFKSN